MKQQHLYDVIIVGGSYAGLAAGMALGRALRSVLIIDSGSPCNQQTPYSHNFLTNDGRTPREITAIARRQVLAYDTVGFLNAAVTEGQKTEKGFEVKTHTGERFRAKELIFATGITDELPSIPGFAACWGISVLHCPYCHGYEVRSQKTGILANGEGGYELSSLLANWTSDLTLFTNGPSTLREQQHSILYKHRISVVEKRIVCLEHNEGQVHHIAFADGESVALKALYARVPFVQHAKVPMYMGCALTAEGYLKVDPAQRTTVAGIYACGDNAARMRTVAHAVCMGTSTGIMVNKELIEESFAK